MLLLTKTQALHVHTFFLKWLYSWDYYATVSRLQRLGLRVPDSIPRWDQKFVPKLFWSKILNQPDIWKLAVLRRIPLRSFHTSGPLKYEGRMHTLMHQNMSRVDDWSSRLATIAEITFKKTLLRPPQYNSITHKTLLRFPHYTLPNVFLINPKGS